MRRFKIRFEGAIVFVEAKNFIVNELGQCVFYGQDGKPSSVAPTGAIVNEEFEGDGEGEEKN